MRAILVRTAVTIAVAIILALITVLYFTVGPLPRETVVMPGAKSEISFIAIGDQGMGNPRQWQVAGAMGRLAAQQTLDFVVLLGDNFYGHGIRDVDDWQWRYKFENVYRGALLSVPFYAVLGNHDYAGNELAQLDYARSGKGTSRWQMPARDYVEYYGHTETDPAGDMPLLRVIYLDTSPGARDLQYTAMQAEALLASGAAVWTVMATHSPVRTARQFYHVEPLLDGLLPVLMRHQVDLYLSGHDHNMQVIERDGEPLYVVTGTGAKWGDAISQPFPGLLFSSISLGFTHVRVSRDQLMVELHDGDGEKIFNHRLVRPDTLETAPMVNTIPTRSE